MYAVDTNVLVRLLTADDKVQANKARNLFKKEAIYIAKTVLLETEWVLRRLYQQEKPAIVDALRKLSALPTVTLEDYPQVQAALAWCKEGMDFADALHLVSAGGASKFATFDVAMKKSAPAAIKTTIQLL